MYVCVKFPLHDVVVDFFAHRFVYGVWMCLYRENFIVFLIVVVVLFS